MMTARSNAFSGIIAGLLIAATAPSAALARAEPPSKAGLIQATRNLAQHAAAARTSAQMNTAASEFILQAQGMTRILGGPDMPLGGGAEFSRVCGPASELMLSYKSGFPQADEAMLSAMLLNMHCLAALLVTNEALGSDADGYEKSPTYAVLADRATHVVNDILPAPMAFTIGANSLTRHRVMGQLQTDWDQLLLPFKAGEKASIAAKLINQAQIAPADVREGLVRLANRAAAAPCGALCGARAPGSAADLAILATPASATLEPPLLRAFTDLSTGACYGVISGATPPPVTKGPEDLEREIAFVQSLGLSYGVAPRAYQTLGEPGMATVQRATLGSRITDDGELVIAFDGPQPGCHVMLLADMPVAEPTTVDAGLNRAGWTFFASEVEKDGSTRRRIFWKRDPGDKIYVMYLTVVADAKSRVRLMSMTLRVPRPKA